MKYTSQTVDFISYKDGRSTSGVTNYYYASTTDSVKNVPFIGDAAWTTNPSDAGFNVINKYLWNYEVISYDDGESTSTAPVVIGVYSKDGKGIDSIAEFYCINATTTCETPASGDLSKAVDYSGQAIAGQWYKTSPPTSSTNKYLWNCERITYTDGVVEIFPPALIGTHGQSGFSIVWKGESKNPPSSPQENWVYKDADDGKVYIYNGTKWELMVLDGDDGTPGAPGAPGDPGLSVFITYNDSEDEPTAPTGDGTTNGWHTNSTSSVIWMSQKVAKDASSGEWGTPIKIKGETGDAGEDAPQTTTQYCQSDLYASAPDASDSGWSNEFPAKWDSDKPYVWTRTKKEWTKKSGNVIEYVDIRLMEQFQVATMMAQQSGVDLGAWCSTNKVSIVGKGMIATGAITTNELAANAITADKLAANAITSRNYYETNEDGSFKTDDNGDYIRANSKTGMKLDLSNGTWDSNLFKITEDGRMIATGGGIGGWSITPSQIYSRDTGISADPNYKKTSLVSSGTSPVRFYCGNTNRIDGNFVVLNDGSLYASAVKLGDETLGDDDSILLSTTDMAGVDGFFDGTKTTNWRMTVGSNFGVTSDGSLYANNAKLSGDITANAGHIGGWEICDGYLEGMSHYIRSSGIEIYQKVQLSPTGIKIWHNGSGYDNFSTNPNTCVTWMQMIWTIANAHGAFDTWEDVNEEN